MDPNSILTNRIRSFQTNLVSHSIDIAILTHSRDVFYYTGVAQPSVFLITPISFHLFIKRGWQFATNDLQLDRQHAVQGNEKDVARKLKELGKDRGVVGLEMDAIAAQTYFAWKKRLSDCAFVDISPIILEQRQVKDENEIALIKQACQNADTGHGRVKDVLKEGISEIELAIEIETALRTAGDEGTAFMRQPGLFLSRVVLGSGPNLYKWTGVAFSITGSGASPALPVGPSPRKIKRGELVVVDLGGCFRGYHADASRTYSVGKADSEILWLFSALKDISDTIISNLRPGVECRRLYNIAFKCAEKHNLEQFFLKLDDKSQTRLVGHGIGLEVNEPPVLSANEGSIVQEGCVLAIEVHIMHPKGVVKLEDDVLVTRHGAEILTSTPRTLIEV
ncbi:MAG: aminopeptidase P family protein [Desulfobacteraceae bacterium]|nr:aminopeptidase P family protein [Desulfobacteraceae bacterium]